MSTVMIVEDDDDVSSLLAAVLTEAGHQPVVVVDPAEVLLELRRSRAELVLLDLAFPGPVSGLDVLRRMQAAGSEVPTLMVTAEGHPAVLDDCLRSGAVGVLVKPFDVGILLTTVTSALSH